MDRYTVTEQSWVYVGFAKGGFEMLWCEYLWVATHPCGGYNSFIHAYKHIFVKLIFMDRYTVTEQSWVYVGFAKGGFEMLWCEYLWVATHPCGGYGGPPPRKFRNMKCSMSDSRPILHKESKKNS